MDITDATNTSDLRPVISIEEYEQLIVNTDRFKITEVNPILLGLYGEVGSIMAASKKYRREKKAYAAYEKSVEEEFGDALWYLSALCRRSNIRLAELFESANHIANNTDSSKISFSSVEQIEYLDKSLMELGFITAQLLKEKIDSPKFLELLDVFSKQYLLAVRITGLSLDNIIVGNLSKAHGRFTIPDKSSLPDFDIDFPEEEQLPRNFEIHISQRQSGQSYLKWKGVFIGSPLTDNIRNPDGYRFHDVFHLAYAAILHWSPTFRALIKHKRKSDYRFDEAQDSGRAIVVEEGLTAWLFSYSKGLDYFEGHDSISFDALKTIEKFVKGYEVDKCPLKLWEDAILQGYCVYRQVKLNNGGIVVGNREERTISYRPAEVK